MVGHYQKIQNVTGVRRVQRNWGAIVFFKLIMAQAFSTCESHKFVSSGSSLTPHKINQRKSCVGTS